MHIQAQFSAQCDQTHCGLKFQHYVHSQRNSMETGPGLIIPQLSELRHAEREGVCAERVNYIPA